MPRHLSDKTIQSAQNPLFRDWRECLQSKGINKHSLFFVFGKQPVTETLRRHPELARSLLFSTKKNDSLDSEMIAFLSRAREQTRHAASPLTVIALDDVLFSELDVFGTEFPLLLMRKPELESFDLNNSPNGLEIAVALGDPANLGALLRSAAAFAVSKIILLKECASPYHPKAVRASSGMTLLTPLTQGPSLQSFVLDRRARKNTLALDMNGESIDSFRWPKDIRLLLGEEGPGLPPAHGLKTVSIKMQNQVESLNATVAASLAMYSYSRSFR